MPDSLYRYPTRPDIWYRYRYPASQYPVHPQCSYLYGEAGGQFVLLQASCTVGIGHIDAVRVSSHTLTKVRKKF